MIGNPHLSAHDHAILQHRTPTDPSLRGHHHVAPDPYVVSHLHQVVELHSIANHRGVQRPAVDRRIRPDLHVVANLQPSNLRKLMEPSGRRVRHKSESISSQHRARLHNHPVAHRRSRINRHPRHQVTILSHHHSRTDHASRTHMASRPNLCPRPHHRQLVHTSRCRHLRRGIDNRRSVHPALASGAPPQLLRRQRKGQPRIFRPQQHLVQPLIDRCIRRHNHRPGRAIQS